MFGKYNSETDVIIIFYIHKNIGNSIIIHAILFLSSISLTFSDNS